MRSPVKAHSGLRPVISNPYGEITDEGVKAIYKKTLGYVPSMHNGIDIVLNGTRKQNYGTELVTPFSGKVVYESFDKPFSRNNNYVAIRSLDGMFEVWYMHNSKNLAHVGDFVLDGETVAYMGNNGTCYPEPDDRNQYAGTHVHFMLKVKDGCNYKTVNPAKYIDLDDYLIGMDNPQNDIPAIMWAIDSVRTRIYNWLSTIKNEKVLGAKEVTAE